MLIEQDNEGCKNSLIGYCLMLCLMLLMLLLSPRLLVQMAGMIVYLGVSLGNFALSSAYDSLQVDEHVHGKCLYNLILR
jgi:hypothetical protein